MYSSVVALDFIIITVCDVLPLVLQKGSQMKVKTSNLYNWLQKSVEFYISFVTQPPSQQEPSTPLSPGTAIMDQKSAFMLFDTN